MCEAAWEREATVTFQSSSSDSQTVHWGPWEVHKLKTPSFCSYRDGEGDVAPKNKQTNHTKLPLNPTCLRKASGGHPGKRRDPQAQDLLRCTAQERGELG